MSPRLYTTEQAAEEIGISRQTLQSWIKGSLITPPKPTLDGAKSKRLWTKADIERGRKVKGTLKPGPKSKLKLKK
jgi:DNA-binding transcriptional MerR regulator